MADLPTFTASSHLHSTYRGGSLTAGTTLSPMITNLGGTGVQSADPITQWIAPRQADVAHYERRIMAGNAAAKVGNPIQSSKQEPVMAKTSTRIVRVFLVDPDVRVPVDKRVLHSTGEITTDDTDQELFFQLPVTDLLAKHNAYREGVEFDEKSDNGGETKRRKGLKPVRIRDLNMTVVTIAQF